MPHLVIDRLRSVPDLCTCSWARPTFGQLPSKRRDFGCACFVEALDIFAGLIFIVGSACFLPYFSHNLNWFLAGCALFVLGALIYVGLCSFTLLEAVREFGWNTMECYENALYLLGSWVFLIGTVLYWPEKAHHDSAEYLKSMAFGVYFNLFSPEFEGTILFIIGSLFFAMAAFINGLNLRAFDSWGQKMLTASTSLYMAGSLLFVMGSVAFLPDLGCNEQMLTIGAICYIVGSVMFTAGGVISLIRTIHELGNPERSQIIKGDDAS